MRVPRFWAVAEGSETGPSGERRFRRAWGWSMASASDALALAQQQLRDALAALRGGVRVGGYYPRKPLREPIVEEFLGDDGEQTFVITRNRYGAEILNTDRVLIADVDLPELEARSARGFLRGLFRRNQPDPEGEPAPVVERLDRIARWAAERPSLGVIVYRTASGLRVFVTGVAEPATSAEGERILAELDADRIYRELCRANETFRARLTPKPWRLPGIKAPRGRWPYADSSAERRFERWLSAYGAASRGFAVCRRLAVYGPGPSSLEAQIIRLHDDRTAVATALPLA